MGAGPVTASPPKRRPSWKLAAPHDTLTQGLVVSGFVGQRGGGNAVHLAQINIHQYEIGTSARIKQKSVAAVAAFVNFVCQRLDNRF